MAGEQRRYRRIVLGLHPRLPPRGLLAAVDLAMLLQLELHGLFIEEAAVVGLAGLPFAREFRLPGGWQPLDAAGLSRDFELAARSSERLFAEAARGLRHASRFEVVRGSLTEVLACGSCIDDILVVVEPASAAELFTLQATETAAAALRSPAAVLLVPPRVVRACGPVVALAVAADDTSLAVAGDIAAAAGEELVVLAPPETAIGPDRLPAGLRYRVERLPAGWAASPLGLVARLGDLRERLVVLTRGCVPDTVPGALSGRRGVPVLVAEPAPGS